MKQVTVSELRELLNSIPAELDNDTIEVAIKMYGKCNPAYVTVVKDAYEHTAIEVHKGCLRLFSSEIETYDAERFYKLVRCKK